MRKLILPVFLVILLSFSVVSFARDYFVMNFENRTIQFSTDDPNAASYFTNNLHSSQVVPIENENGFVILFTPYEYTLPQKNLAKESIKVPEPENGKLIICSKQGNMLNSFDLGFARFRTAVAPNCDYVLVSYRIGKTEDNYEISCFETKQKNLLKMSLNGIRNVYDIQFARSSNTAYLLGLDNDLNHVLLTIETSPFRIKSQTKIGQLGLPGNMEDDSKAFSKLYVLKDNNLIILNYGGRNPQKNEETIHDASVLYYSPGVVCVFDPNNKQIIAEKELYDETFPEWLPESQTLFIANRSIQGKPTQDLDDAEWFGHGQFLKVNDQGIKTIYTPTWFDYHYDRVNDRIYYLSFNEMNVSNFSDNITESWNIGRNTYSLRETIMLMTSPDLFHLEDPTLGFCWNMKNGKVRIIDLQSKKVIARFKGALFSKKALFNKDGKTLIATNIDHSRFYVMQQKNIQIYDRSFKELTPIKFTKNLIGLYQLENPRILIAVTHDKIYRLEDDQAILIHEFKTPTVNVYFLKDGDRFVMVTDYEMLEFTSSTFKSIKTLEGIFEDRVKIRFNCHNERKIQFRPLAKSEDVL